MVAVAGKPAVELNITVIGGTFYNHHLGGDQAPHLDLLPAFPSVAYDTFVSIGVTCVGDPPCQPVDTLTITPGFPTGITGSSLAGRFGWAITPAAPQGDPFNTPFSFPGNGKILLGRYSTADGTAISGTMLIQFVDNGVSGLAVVSFYHVPTPGALAVMVGAGLFGTRRRRR